MQRSSWTGLTSRPSSENSSVSGESHLAGHLVVLAHTRLKAQSGQIHSKARDVSSDNILGGFLCNSSTHKTIHRNAGRDQCGPPTFRDPKTRVKSECMTTSPRSNPRRHPFGHMHLRIIFLALSNVADRDICLKNIRFPLILSLCTTGTPYKNCCRD